MKNWFVEYKTLGIVIADQGKEQLAMYRYDLKH